MLKSNEVNKIFVMSKEDATKLLTETCVKCKHLIDDHLRSMKQIKGKLVESEGKYVCRNCGCKID